LQIQADLLKSSDNPSITEVNNQIIKTYKLIEEKFYPTYEAGNIAEARKVLNIEIEPVLLSSSFSI